MNMLQHRKQQGTSGGVGHLAVYSEGDHHTLYQERKRGDPDNGGDVPVPYHFQRGHAQHVGILGHHSECSNNYRDMVLPQIAESGNVPCQHTETMGKCSGHRHSRNVQHRATQRAWTATSGTSPVRTRSRHQPLCCSIVLSNVWAMQTYNLIRKTPPGYQLSVDTHLLVRGNPRTTTRTKFATWPGPQCGNMLERGRTGGMSNMDAAWANMGGTSGMLRKNAEIYRCDACEKISTGPAGPQKKCVACGGLYCVWTNFKRDWKHTGNVWCRKVAHG